MKLCVATTWDNRLVHELQDIGIQYKDIEIHEFFGSLQTSVTGSGRESISLSSVSEKKAREHIEIIHAYGIEFNYLVNSACLGNREFSVDGQRELINYLKLIRDLKADTITITLPYLIEIVKDQFPEFKVNLSTIAHVESITRARYFCELGVDRITLSFMANRDFNLLVNLAKFLDVGLEILVNESCLFDCPLRMYHYNLVSHGSQGATGAFFLQYPFFRCTLTKLKNPTELLKARWVRPEDIARYEKLGIGFIKLAGREKTTDWLIRCAKAYASRHYEGNLLDIIAMVMPGANEFSAVDGQLSPENVPDAPCVYIDNTELDNFLDFFQESKIDCRVACGVSCHYCYKVAERVIKVDEGAKIDYINALKYALKCVSNGKFVKHLNTAENQWVKELTNNADSNF